MNRIASQKWVKPLLIAVILMVTCGIILIAVLAGQTDNKPTGNDLTIVSTAENADYRYHLYSDDTIGIAAYLGSNHIITIPEAIESKTVRRIEDSAFEGSALTGIVLPETIHSVGKRAFYGAEMLTSLTIPDSVKTIGKDAFLVQKNGASSFIPWVYSRNTDFVVVGDGILIAYIGAAPEKLEIPDDVKHISRFYFNTTSITSLTLPDSLMSIGESAFEDFTKIQSVTFPDKLQEIGARGFYNCQSLTKLTLPDTTLTIASEAFACCPKMKTADLPSVATIGNRAFAYCLGLTSVDFSDKKLTYIGDEAFAECSLLSEVEIPNSVTHLGLRALKGTAWMLSQKDKEFVVTSNGMLVGYNGNGGQVTVEDTSISVIADAFRERTDITGIILGNSVTALSPGAFENCTSLSAFVASKYLKTVGARAFAGCSALVQADLLDGVTAIGENTFENCVSLMSIVLPKNLKVIAENCFAGCETLQNVTLPTALQTVMANAFGGCPLEKVIFNGSAKQKKAIQIKEGNAVFSALMS